MFDFMMETKFDSTVSFLEKKFADRGLRFTSTFEGTDPVQAYGHLDGLRFYFRFRYDSASLVLGDVGNEEAGDSRYYPSKAVRTASIDAYTGSSDVGSISSAEAYDLMNKLVLKVAE
jgi:hypothetical protein